MKCLMFILLVILVLCCLCPIALGGMCYYFLQRPIQEQQEAESLIWPLMINEIDIAPTANLLYPFG